MTQQVHDKIATGAARVVPEPAIAAPAVARPNAPRHQVEIDRNFELPTGLFGATVALYLGFLAVMFAGFGNPGLVIPMAIFALFIVAGFGVPALWVRLRDNDSAPMTAARFKADGIVTHTGRLAPRDAAIQMLILPTLIVGWGCTVVVIAALV
ncbi:MAG: hypothetical protein WA936_08070 [Erythrobacter sp.]|uniref:hypothetical protein n=1 Tax=Erythrobacter sp. TaxID=1042 RepID=UPI003C77BB55